MAIAGISGRGGRDRRATSTCAPEYPHAIRTMNAAVEIRDAGKACSAWIRRHGLAAAVFDLEVRCRRGAPMSAARTTSAVPQTRGSKASREKALVRGQAAACRPCRKAVFGKPTVVNNVISLASRCPSVIMDNGTPNSIREEGLRHGPFARTIPHPDLAGQFRQAWRAVRGGLRADARRRDFGGGQRRSAAARLPAGPPVQGGADRGGAPGA